MNRSRLFALLTAIVVRIVRPGEFGEKSVGLILDRKNDNTANRYYRFIM